MQSYNVLFLCTHNSARSVLGEMAATLHSNGRLIGYSAGSSPRRQVHPMAVEIAQQVGYPPEKLRSKSWDVFAAPGAPEMDFIVTVCDNAAGEVCPIWPGHPATAHWGFPDPSAVSGSDEDRRRAFREVMVGLQKRVELLAALPLETLDLMSRKALLQSLHQQSS